MPCRETCQLVVRSVTLELALSRIPHGKRNTCDAPAIREGHISFLAAYRTYRSIWCRVRDDFSGCCAGPVLFRFDLLRQYTREDITSAVSCKVLHQYMVSLYQVSEKGTYHQRSTITIYHEQQEHHTPTLGVSLSTKMSSRTNAAVARTWQRLSVVACPHTKASLRHPFDFVMKNTQRVGWKYA